MHKHFRRGFSTRKSWLWKDIYLRLLTLDAIESYIGCSSIAHPISIAPENKMPSDDR